MSSFNKLVKEYYSDKFETYGATNKGVDWPSQEFQIKRFIELTKIITTNSHFNLLDYGCGYGAYYEFLSNLYEDFFYHGVDLVDEMIKHAAESYQENINSLFTVDYSIKKKYDYIISSGIFNVKMNNDELKWEQNFYETLNLFNEKSSKGFSFNCLTSYSDPDKMELKLFYPDPCKIFEYCKKHFSNNIALLHDYGLYEFTILVRK